MAATIQVSQPLLEMLKTRKQYDKESYEEVIWDLAEDSRELYEETKRSIELARAEIRSGKSFKHAHVKKILGL